MACVIKVTVKDSLKSMTKKFTVYEEVTADYTDPKIDKLVADATKNFGGEPTKVKVVIELLQD